MADEDLDTGPAPELIEEARTMGWRPKEEYKGDPEKWVDADEYVEKGRHVMPILLENNKRLQKERLTQSQKIGTLEAQIEELRAAQAELMKNVTEANKRDVVAAKATLKQRLKDARDDGDLDAELDIQDALKALDAEPKPAATPAKKQTNSEIDPEVQEWMDENPWFSSSDPEDKKRAKAYQRLAEDLRDDGNKKIGRAFMDDVDKAFQKQSGKQDPGSDKFDSGSNRPAGSNGAKTYSALPAEAKRACMEDVERFVGPGKKYTDVKQWQNEYAKIYHEDNE